MDGWIAQVESDMEHLTVLANNHRPIPITAHKNDKEFLLRLTRRVTPVSLTVSLKPGFKPPLSFFPHTKKRSSPHVLSLIMYKREFSAQVFKGGLLRWPLLVSESFLGWGESEQTEKPREEGSVVVGGERVVFF